MKLPLDRSLKLLWFAVGVLLLLFLAGAGVMILSQVIGNARAGREASRVASDSPTAGEPPPIAVRYALPRPIRGTETRIVTVNHGPGYGATSSGDSYSRRDRSGMEVNAMFVDAGGVRLLLDRPAYIREVSYPAPDQSDGGGEAEEAPREWISYVLALDDGNGDGRLDYRDAVALYVTDLQGRSLRPVIRPPFRYQSHEAFGPGRILVYALEPPRGEAVPEERMRQRAFLYDVRTSHLTAWAAMDSAAEQAGRILAR
ncbi:MAG TPA: hypothetical protein VHG08_27765 [Longimicrobium sp.]|nr:hypothetical protein [Longimicrobium sp.]